MSDRNLENLRVWTDTRIFVNEIYNMMQSCHDYGFRDQLQRASVSIMNNIAEGFESSSDKMFVRYLSISKGSCSEVKSMLYLCEDRNIVHYRKERIYIQCYYQSLVRYTN